MYTVYNETSFYKAIQKFLLVICDAQNYGKCYKSRIWGFWIVGTPVVNFGK